MIKITCPDGSIREYEKGITGLEIAKSISSALARDVLSIGVNGKTTELNRPINEDATIALYKWEDEEGKHTFWHSSAHLLAEALQALYPGIQFGFGPAVENGFFYDVMTKDGTPISENDFPKIEEKMREFAKRDEAIVRREVSKSDALKEFKEDGQEYKCEHIDLDLEDGTISTYSQGAFTDLCRGPHLMSTGPIKAIKLTSVLSDECHKNISRAVVHHPNLVKILGVALYMQYDPLFQAMKRHRSYKPTDETKTIEETSRKAADILSLTPGKYDFDTGAYTPPEH